MDGHSCIHTWFFASSIWVLLVTKSFLDKSVLTCQITNYLNIFWAGFIGLVCYLAVCCISILHCYLAPVWRGMCKHICDTLALDFIRVHPWALCDIIPDVEGHSRVHTWVFASSIWILLVTKSFLDINKLELRLSGVGFQLYLRVLRVSVALRGKSACFLIKHQPKSDSPRRTLRARRGATAKQ